MSLSTTDLHAIRNIVEEETRRAVQVETRPIVQEELSREIAPVSIKLSSLLGKVAALENDIKEIYDMITKLQSETITDKQFKKRSIEEKLLTLNAKLIATAKQAGVTLPRP